MVTTTLLFGIIALTLVLWSFSRGSRTDSFRFPVHLHFSDLWKWQGKISRGTYAFAGVTLFAIKHNIDRTVATLVFGRQFTVFNYWVPPADAVQLNKLSGNDARFL